MTSSTQKRALVFVAQAPTDETEPETFVACLRTLAEALGKPVALGIGHRLVLALSTAAREALARAFLDGALRLVYVPAHDTDPTLLDPEELIDELRLDEECLHEVIGAPAPERRCLVLPSLVGSGAIAALEAHGIDALVTPVGPSEPVRVGERLVWLSGVELHDGDASLPALARERRGTAFSTLEELQQPLTPPWLPRIEVEAPVSPASSEVALLGWLMDAFGYPRAPRVPASALFAFDYELERLPWRVRVALLYRLARSRGGLVQAAVSELLQLLSVELELGARPEPEAPLPTRALPAVRELGAYEALLRNGWRGRDRWRQLLAAQTSEREAVTASSWTSA